MTNILYEVAHVDYDEYSFIGIYSSLRRALDCFFNNQDKVFTYRNANYIKVVILDSEKSFTLYSKSLEECKQHYMEIADVVQLTRVDMIDDDKKKLFELKKILARYEIWNLKEAIEKFQNQINEGNLNDRQLDFKKHQIAKYTQEKNILMNKYYKEVHIC